ncbi:MAG: hypothetical protein OEW58_11265 [Gammaproteobacteria bacterium]|nr:hypothetical protein [Gammaproteobacteria bacterium]
MASTARDYLKQILDKDVADYYASIGLGDDATLSEADRHTLTLEQLREGRIAAVDAELELVVANIEAAPPVDAVKPFESRPTSSPRTPVTQPTSSSSPATTADSISDQEHMLPPTVSKLPLVAGVMLLVVAVAGYLFWSTQGEQISAQGQLAVTSNQEALAMARQDAANVVPAETASSKDQSSAVVEKQQLEATVASKLEQARREQEAALKAEALRKAQEEKAAQAKRLEDARKAEEARKLAEASRAEALRKAQEEKAAQAARLEEARKAEEARKLAEAKRAEAIRKAQEAKLAAEAKRAEQVKKAEEAKRIEEARKAEAVRVEQARKAEEARKVAEAKQAEEARKAADAKRAEAAQKSAAVPSSPAASAIVLPDLKGMSLTPAAMPSMGMLITHSDLLDFADGFSLAFEVGDQRALRTYFSEKLLAGDSRLNKLENLLSESLQPGSVRKLRFSNIQWDIGTGNASGKGVFQISVKKGAQVKKASGRVNMQLSGKDGRLVITQFDYSGS